MQRYYKDDLKERSPDDIVLRQDDILSQGHPFGKVYLHVIALTTPNAKVDKRSNSEMLCS
jgi:hypothetical protein